VAIPDPNFRPDVNRAVGVFGELTDQTVSELAKEILALRANPAPITVLINSPGGDPRVVHHLYDLLKTVAPTGRRSRIITVAVGNVASSAANLLSLGDYAIAYPRVTIHFHGLRFPEVEEVTMEFASVLAHQLQLRNQQTALMLAKAGTVRLAFHLARLSHNFPQLRSALSQKDLSDIECLAECLRRGKMLSPDGERIIDKALKRWKYVQELSVEIMPKAAASGKKGLEFGGTVLSHIVKSQVKRCKWKGEHELTEEAVNQIISNWMLLREYDMGGHMRHIQMIAKRFQSSFFTPEEIKEISAEPRSEAAEGILLNVVNRAIRPFCYFAHCIWLALQEEENPLSARDAFALGVIDEVYDSRLPSLRETMESQPPEQPNLPARSSSAPGLPSEQLASSP
jgi:ATP-dependent protease ClpP protease subunit